MTGWIKLHRLVTAHWIWSDPKKLKWWLTILLKVNHESKKVLIGNNLVTVGKGESVRSLRSWAMEFRTTPKTVKTFFNLLQKDGMIETKSIQFSTHLKVCKWNTYQETVNAKYTDGKQTLPTNKNVLKNEKENGFSKKSFSTAPPKKTAKQFIDENK